MERRDLVLAVLSCADRDTHSPVVVQKMFFLIDKNIPNLVDGPHFNFVPYHYGPYDAAVYYELRSLAAEGLVEEGSNGRWSLYRLTNAGQEKGEKQFAQLPEDAQDYIQRLSDVVRSLSFSELVSAIYKAYPEMKTNSVFQSA